MQDVSYPSPSYLSSQVVAYSGEIGEIVGDNILEIKSVCAFIRVRHNTTVNVFVQCLGEWKHECIYSV